MENEILRDKKLSMQVEGVVFGKNYFNITHNVTVVKLATLKLSELKLGVLCLHHATLPYR
jgi:hypothetical protein